MTSQSLAFETGVNFTAGLPIVRTSPDHGPAYDLAGKNIASESSFRNAIFTAIDVFKHRANLETHNKSPLKRSSLKEER